MNSNLAPMQGTTSTGQARSARREFGSVNNDPSDLTRISQVKTRKAGTRISQQQELAYEVIRANTHRYIKGTTIKKPPPNTEEGSLLVGILLHPLNLLLIFLPIGTVAFFLEWDDSYIFWFNFFAMIPLAKILGDATEELAASLQNDMVAGLLNATFGNAVEMVITIKTLRAGLFDVVKSTLLGSVLSNTLLVLGMSFFCGGLFSLVDTTPPQYKSIPAGAVGHIMQNRRVSGFMSSGEFPSGIESNDCEQGMETPRNDSNDSLADHFVVNEKIQKFSVLGALVNTSMLLISCTSFSLITVFHTVADKSHANYRETVLLPVSRIASVIIIMAYVAYTVFQLVTHKEAMATEDEEPNQPPDNNHLSTAKSVALLASATIIVSCCTEMLVHAIGGVTQNSNISKRFIGIILLPIVGNACEHAAAVRFAMQNKLGLSVSIAVGSSTQIALLVVPFAVLAGWVFGLPMDLNFGMLSTSMITLSVIVVLSMVVDGQSNWLQGYLLCSVYAIIAVMYWYLPDLVED